MLFRSYTRLQSDLAGQKTIEPDSVTYGADGVQTLAHDAAKYFRDLSAGVDWTMKDLEKHAKPRACPNQQIVLAGFSQGAMVMHRVLHLLGKSSAGKQILSHVVAAVLVGDGDQVPFDHETRFGSAWRTARGVGLVLPALSGSSWAKFSPSLAPRVLRVCDFGDYVCDNLNPVVGVIPGIAIHLSYPNSKPLRKATDQAASNVLTLH